MNMTMSQINADIIAAKQAIDYYDKKHIKDIKNVAAYHIQQAAEKLIKIQIYSAGNSINHASLYTHNLEKLILYAFSLGISLSVPEYIRNNSLVITGWEAGSRYDVGFQIRIDSLKKTYVEIEKWYTALYSSGLRQA